MIIVICLFLFAMPLPHSLTQLLPEHLHPLCEPANCSAGTALFLTGEPPRWMFFVSAGEVVLERHGLHGQLSCLQRCRTGFVGEASLTSSHYHCDARSTVDSRITRVPIKDLREALQRDSPFSERWIHMLSREVRRLRLQNERLSLPKVQDRLLHLVETEGDAGHYTLTCPVKELAKQLAVTHEALYRALAELQRTGRIARFEQVITLL